MFRRIMSPRQHLLADPLIADPVVSMTLPVVTHTMTQELVSSKDVPGLGCKSSLEADLHMRFPVLHHCDIYPSDAISQIH